MLYSWLINTLHRADNFLLENETMAGKGVQIYISCADNFCSLINHKF